MLPPFQGYLDFSRPIVAVSGEAIRKGRAAYRRGFRLKIKMAAGWAAQSLQGLSVDSLDDPLAIQATPEERERFDRGEPLLVRANMVGGDSSFFAVLVLLNVRDECPSSYELLFERPRRSWRDVQCQHRGTYNPSPPIHGFLLCCTSESGCVFSERSCPFPDGRAAIKYRRLITLE
ncbi:hypothetical protein [Bradyrhizobium sp.]|uniref:hypothetical protein n=1 Tax=Bradyrhizobium sp. TaxID=376 RepID=UPI0025BBEC72|nr:hypothetical protein [Bradyrhizobium sp.]